MATGPDVGVRFSPEELAIIDALAEEREWSRAQVVRNGFKRALAAGLLGPPRPQPEARPSRPAPANPSPPEPVDKGTPRRKVS